MASTGTPLQGIANCEDGDLGDTARALGNAWRITAGAKRDIYEANFVTPIPYVNRPNSFQERLILPDGKNVPTWSDIREFELTVACARNVYRRACTVDESKTHYSSFHRRI
jgi:hypothetical protein